jgi:hypothetical protein
LFSRVYAKHGTGRLPISLARNDARGFRSTAFAASTTPFFAAVVFEIKPAKNQFPLSRGSHPLSLLPRLVRAKELRRLRPVCPKDVFELKKAGKQAGVNCEACHGPQAKLAG